jgi:hypothetical protein
MSYAYLAVLITCTLNLQSPNHSIASFHDTGYDRLQTIVEYGIGIFELFAWLDKRDARCTRQIKSRIITATATFNKKTLYTKKWT